MSQLQVDFIVGRRFSELNSIERYARELIRHCGSEINGLIVGYDFDFPLPGLERLPAIFYYPFVVKKRCRPNSIKHMCSHIQAQLLNYLDLKPSVVTCHDIFPYLEPRYPLAGRATAILGLRGMMKADIVITNSAFTRDELITHFGYPESRIRVIHFGVDHERYKPRPRDDGFLERLGIEPTSKVLLYVGSEQPRKNLHNLFRAIALVRRERDDVILLKVGRPQWKGARKGLINLSEKLGILKCVKFVDYIPEEDLPTLYSSADLFVFPSLYEGFGLPPLEAMACGCPVICSNVTSLPEVIGDAGVTVDPLDVEGMTEAILDILNNDDKRMDLISKGVERASLFSWEKTAKETLKVYEELLGDL